MKKYSFAKQNTTAKKGEDIVLEYLKKEHKNVLDVRNDKTYRKKDIDFVIDVKSLLKYTIELKSDDKISSTGNFFFETISNSVRSTLGCFMMSQADFFYYYDTKGDKLYIFDLQRLRNWFIKNMDKFSRVVTSTKDATGKYLYKSYGRIVSKDLVLKYVPCTLIEKLSTKKPIKKYIK